MKFRSDFVTNSSSSSFVLSMGKGEGFTEKQKKIILDYAEKALLGKIISVPEKKMTEDEYYEWSEKNDIYIGFKNLKKIQKLAKKGEKIRVGEVSFETPDDNMVIYQDLWNQLNGVDGFKIIDGDLYY